MFKRVVILFLAVVLGLCFASEALAQAKFKVAIVRTNNRLTYLEGQEGVISGFKKEGFDESKVEFDLRNYEDSDAKLVEICKDLQEKKVDVIMTLGTDASGGVAKEVKDIPVVFSQVSDPVTSGFAASWESSGRNTTGTSTYVDFAVVIKVLREVSPVKRLGLLYAEKDEQSVIQLEAIKKLQTKMGFTVVPASIKTTEEAGDGVKSLVGRVDSIFVAAGSTIGKGIGAIVEVASSFKIPTISTAPDKAELGLLLSVASSRIKLGELAAKKAIEILNGKKPSDIPIEPLKSYDIFVNLKTAHAMGMQIPAALLKAATEVIKEK